jgi:uncharacterized membrane protein YccF (DUF307 family)
VASFRLAGFVIWPFGRTVVRRPSAGAGSAIGNAPLAIANLKLAAVAIAPLGKDVVDPRDPRAAGQMIW